MARYTIDLEKAYRALEASDGAVSPAAASLGVPPHSLKSLIDANAELQSITRNRAIKIVDKAHDVVLQHMEGDLTVSDSRVNSVWKALTNGDPDTWSPKSKVDVNSNRTFSDMSEQELMEYLHSSPELLKLAKGLEEAKDA